MIRTMIRTAAALTVLAVLAAPAVHAQGFGNIKGQIVWAGDPPAAEALKLDKDAAVCLAHGALLSQKYVVDPKSKGVRYLVVWLVDPKAGNVIKGPPVNPALKAIPAKDKKVVIDQPFCQFEPHVLALREGQSLVIRNSAKIPHNTNIVSSGSNPNLNPIIAPGDSKTVPASDWHASPSASSVSCTIHGWMKGYIRVFNHPYFAVTDANGNFEIKGIPAGTWNLIVWHEEKGYDATAGGKTGTPVTVTASETKDLGKIDMKP
jgi:hypothetical protein